MAEYMEPEMVTMEDAAGTAAEEAYTAALESGADPLLPFGRNRGSWCCYDRNGRSSRRG